MLRAHLIYSLLLRVLLVVYGEWHDGFFDVKFTDIDYNVFNDAAGLVKDGRSPYLRRTYRYTPLLAWLLIPNHVAFRAFGKVLFVLLDVFAGWIIHEILSFTSITKSRRILLCSLWLYNPLTAVVSSRGNAESMMAVLVLLCVYLLMKNRVILCAICYGMAIHVKIYPVIYSLLLLLVIDREQPLIAISSTPMEDHGKKKRHSLTWIRLFTPKRIQFIVVSMLTLFFATSLFYSYYGWEFVYQAYVYHLTRKDFRHNFSMYFYVLYLTAEQGSWLGSLISVLAFLPQFLLVQIAAVVLHHTFLLCFFVQTLIFVTFNKVCTSQYFLWYLCFLPISLNQEPLQWAEAVLMATLWFIGQGMWLLPAYLLEFQGLNSFLCIWTAGIVFYGINVWITGTLISKQRLAVTSCKDN